MLALLSTTAIKQESALAIALTAIRLAGPSISVNLKDAEQDVDAFGAATSLSGSGLSKSAPDAVVYPAEVFIDAKAEIKRLYDELLERDHELRGCDNEVKWLK
ncbi:hypothetical protein EVJ58_g8626 [Rhodofomes roseus]|uniref:Uncharacterized protein n=1 Tax=Rhodofomes roseus TaxID=34475 RepID=A0A4Y9XYS4_9APHY|nr:hypothetical protein EVJ58_g8626 [Rhodofomes roseus]